MNQYRHRASLICAIVVNVFGALGPQSYALADAAEERAELRRLIHELETLELIAQRAEAASVSTQRVRFQYGWLRGDIEKVKAGIREYLDTVPVTPRAPAPLAGDYLR